MVGPLMFVGRINIRRFNLEHRIGRRKKVKGLVELWQDDNRRGVFELANIGSGGLFLKSRQTAFNEGETFTIKSKIGNPVGLKGHYLKAMVVHRTDNGIGLMWAGCHSAFLANLDHILNQAA